MKEKALLGTVILGFVLLITGKPVLDMFFDSGIVTIIMSLLTEITAFSFYCYVTRNE